jgi:DNA-binding NtrC family response regulator
MKLLRVLETGRFSRLGSNREREVSVRVISATNADLPRMIGEGRFREDLYYRLNLIQIHLPTLQERPDDILPLAEHFLSEGKTLGPGVRQALLRHDWPGNVRELKNCIQRACLLSAKPEIGIADLNLPACKPGTAAPTGEPDRAQIEAALHRARGVIALAASELGLSRQALYRRMERLGIERA